MADTYLITTIDNPFNPFTEFDEWYKEDCDKGYNTWQKIEKLMPSDYLRMNESYRDKAISEAIDILIDILPGIYYKVFESDSKDANKFREMSKIANIKAQTP